MSCNGCRVLRKGCSDTCVLRSCLSWIDSAESQGHATVFVAKFFGRAGMMSFINAVDESQRPAVFQSLLFEACGRTVNPVFGAVGLLWSGNWGLCQAAVETVLKGGLLKPVSASGTNCSIQFQSSPVLKRYGAEVKSQETEKKPAISKKRNRSNSISSAVVKDHSQEQINNKMPRLGTSAAESDDSRSIMVKYDHHQSAFKAVVLDQREQICRDTAANPRPGQLVAPKARRAVAATGSHDPLIANIVATKQQQQIKQQQLVANHVANRASCSVTYAHDQAETVVELGLTLNFAPASTSAGHGCFKPSREPTTAAASNARPHSPLSASISVNSEGSVTSSDTADFSVSCFSVYGADKESCSQRLPQRQLLHLI